MMNTIQIYVVFGLPLIASLVAVAAIFLVRRSAARVDRADLNVYEKISERRKHLDNIALEGVNGLEGKIQIVKSNTINLKKFGE